MSYLSRLDEVVQELEQNPHHIRIKKLLYSTLTKKWNNDLNRLNSLSLTNLVQELHEECPTLAHIKYIIYGIVIRLNKPTEYSLIADIITNEMEKLYPQVQRAPQVSSRDDYTNYPLQFDNQQGKLVVLNLEGGNFGQEIKATLEIVEANNLIDTRVVTWLPTAREILENYDSWQSIYRRLDVNSRRGDPATRFTNTSSISRLQQCSHSAEVLKSSLNNWYNSTEFSQIRDKLEELNEAEEIRIIIRSQNNRLWQLPWNLFFDAFLNRYPNAEVALSVPKARRASTQLMPRNKVRSLVVLGNTTAINISAEFEQLSALPDSEVVLLAEPSREELDEKLGQQDWSIVVFSSYSSSHSEPGRIYINKTESLTNGELKSALRDAVGRGLKLAIFNFEDGLGLARELASLHVPHIIVMREVVPNPVAQEFLKRFLQAFSDDKSLYAAVREARERLQPLENVFPGATWLPVICQNSAAVPLTWQECRLPLKKQLKKQYEAPPDTQAEETTAFSTLLLNKSEMTIPPPPPLSPRREKISYENVYLANTLTGYSSEVYSLAISPNGQTLVSGCGDIVHEDDTIKIWNLATGTLLRTLKGHHHWVYAVAISPDGQTLVSGSLDSAIKIWDLATGTLRRPDIDNYHGVNTVALSPDGETIVSGSDDGTIKIWYLNTGTLIRTLTGHYRAVNSVAISPHRRNIVSGSDDGTIKIWNLDTGTLIRTLTARGDRVFSVAISPDGQRIVSGSASSTIKIWNLDTGACLNTLTGHDKAVNAIAYALRAGYANSPDSQTIVSGSLDKTIKIWNLDTGTLINTLTGHDNSVLSLAISPDGQTIVSGSYGEIRIWRVSP
jgi:WD40 repeat protein